MFTYKLDGNNKYINKFINYVQNTLHIYGADDSEDDDDNDNTGDIATYNQKDIDITDSCIQELENYIAEHGKLPDKIESLLK